MNGALLQVVWFFARLAVILGLSVWGGYTAWVTFNSMVDLVLLGS